MPLSPAKCVLFFPLQNSNGIYTGFIKVQMELCRPSQTSPSSGKLAPSSSGCMNTLHISSANTVGEVIEALLKKFLVTESPTKFALYKRCHREDQGNTAMLKIKVVSAFISLSSVAEGRLMGVTFSVTSEPRDRFWKPQ